MSLDPPSRSSYDPTILRNGASPGATWDLPRFEGLSATESVRRIIREAIVDGRLSAGDRLPSERDLAAQFGVSRTSVREALRVLSAAMG